MTVATAAPTDDLIPYQRVLRMIGAVLDEHEARLVTVLEVTDGMVARWETHDGEVATSHVPFTDLLSVGMERSMGRSRGVLFQRGHHPQYQDTLRALGRQLQQFAASTILIDEGEWGLLVSYQHYSPSRGYNLQKEALLVGAPEQQSLVELVRHRRRLHGFRR